MMGDVPLLPMLASAGTHVPTGEEWSHEVKWDGVRAIARLEGGLRLTSRNGNDITGAWPEVARAPDARDLVVDGEIIALNERGLPDFRVLAERIHVRKATAVARLAERIPATFMAFDLLRHDGEDLTSRSLAERRARLEALDLAGTGWQVPSTYDDGAMLFEATRTQGLEGIVSKRVESRYRPGERTQNWLKFAHRHRGSYVVGGWRPQTGGTHLAALLVGEPTAAGLSYRGRVGSGIGPRQSRTIAELVAPLTRSTSPFVDDVPKVDAQGTIWVEPVLVVDIDSHGTGYERLRQPSYQGIRSDVTPDDLRVDTTTESGSDE